MTEKCFESGTIQAFLDGELNDETLERAARHFSVCDDCAALLAEAETESALAFSALDNELNLLVPTERIRANLYGAIAAEKKSFRQKIFGGGFGFLNPSIAAFASLLLAAGIFSTLLVLRQSPNRNIETAEVKTQNSEARAEIVPVKIESTKTVKENSAVKIADVKKTEIPRANFKPNTENRAAILNADYKVSRVSVKNPAAAAKAESNNAPPAKNENLSGEESYLRTIATLSETVDSRKDETLKPGARVAFEKNLAVVNDSISKMRRQVRSNPKNEAARELLRSSYQNKIDLLNSVADKSEMMATLR